MTADVEADVLTLRTASTSSRLVAIGVYSGPTGAKHDHLVSRVYYYCNSSSGVLMFRLFRFDACTGTSDPTTELLDLEFT